MNTQDNDYYIDTLKAEVEALRGELYQNQTTMGDMWWMLDIVHRKPCPQDTDGDGDCGAKMCPYCGAFTRRTLERADELLRRSGRRK